MTDDMKPAKPGLIRAMVSADLADLASAIGEVVLDTAMDPSVLRELPLIGIAQKIVAVGANVHVKMFARKVCTFLEKVQEATVEEREKFIERFATEGDQKEFNDQVLLYLDQADSFDKPAIIGRLTTACIRGHLSLGELKRLSAMVNRSYAVDLNLLTRFTDGVQGENAPIAESLHAVGFLSIDGIDGGTFEGGGGIVYRLNHYGRFLVEYGGLSGDS
jgi:hypothetical protein